MHVEKLLVHEMSDRSVYLIQSFFIFLCGCVHVRMYGIKLISLYIFSLTCSYSNQSKRHDLSAGDEGVPSPEPEGEAD